MNLQVKIPKGWRKLAEGSPLRNGDMIPNIGNLKWEPMHDVYFNNKICLAIGRDTVQEMEIVIRKINK